MELKLPSPRMPRLPWPPRLPRWKLPKGWLSVVVVLAIVLPIALFLGLVAAIGLGLPMAVLLAGVALLTFLLGRFGLGSYRLGGNGIFWSSIVLAVGLGMLALISPVRVSALFELWFIALVPWILLSTPATLRAMPMMRIVVLLFLFSIVFAVISTAMSHYLNPKAAIYQFAYNLKWPLMLLVGFRVCWQEQDHARLRWLAWAFVIIALAFIALRLGSQGTYLKLARNLIESPARNPLLGGITIRHSGPFMHSSVLSYFSTLLLVMLVVQRRLGLVRLLPGLCLGAALMAVSLLSGQMQEFGAMLVGCGLVWVACRVRNMWTMLIAGGIATVMAAGMFVAVAGTGTVTNLGVEWGLLPDVRALNSARPVFYSDSFRLATEHFPVGTGLGTFGSVGATYFNRDMLDAMGYSSMWWYAQGTFLLDTYWPNFIAELGWIGAISLMLVPTLLVLYSLWRITAMRTPQLKAVWGYAFAGQFVLLGVSLTSPIYSDPNLAAFALMMFGMAFAYERRVTAAQQQPAVAP